MIAQYQAEERKTGFDGGNKAEDILCSPRQYGIAQMHKHLPEITAATDIDAPPAFLPIVADYYSGMEVTVPIKVKGLTKAQVEETMKAYYADQPMVKYVDSMDDGGFVAGGRLSGKNNLEITVEGNDDNILLIATYDNLGKGASGAAIQNMNIMLGLDETKGLL